MRRVLGDRIIYLFLGTFKTVPSILYQLYTIHGLVARGNNHHVFPLAYCIMSGKSEELYRIVFEVRSGMF